MGRDLFSVPIFFIVLRETVEAAIIVSVLLSFCEQLMRTGHIADPHTVSRPRENGEGASSTLLERDQEAEQGVGTTRLGQESDPMEKDEGEKRVARLIRRMRIQIWAGTISGFVIALSIGAAFIAVFYTKLVDLWGQTEQIWEGVFSIIACIIIYIMGVAFLKMDRARVKWRVKLAAAFEKSHSKAIAHHRAQNGELQLGEEGAETLREGRTGKWALFLLPFITVLREGLEAVVFVGGVSLNLDAASIPIPVVVGLLVGSGVGYLIYKTGSTASLHWFLVGSTCFLFLIGAGLASKGVGFFQYYRFASGVGSDVSESGDGPGSFQVAGNVWHLTYGNPETGSPTTNGGWQIFNAILGWNNTATLGSILSYVAYWLVVAATLVYLKWKEGRSTFFGKKSKIYEKRSERRAAEEEQREYHGQSVESPGEDKKGPMETPLAGRPAVLELRE